MSTTSQNIETRLPEFDLLRSLAIIGVIIIHTTAPLELYAHNGIFLYYLFAVIHLAQRFCVPVFLIISGFFLTYKTDNEQKPTSVLKKRLSRIIPPYIFWSFFYYFLEIASGKRSFNLPLLLEDLLTGSAVTSYYFIILIIQFYALWWLNAKFKVFNYTNLLLIALACQILITVYLYNELFHVHYFSSMEFMYRFIGAWSFYFVFGLFLGKNYTATKKALKKLRKPLILITIVFFLLSVAEFNLIDGSNLYNTIDNTITVNIQKLESSISYWRVSSQLYSIALFLLILSLNNSSLVKLKTAKVFNKIAEYSFAIYLIHHPLLWKLIFRVFHLLGTGSLASFVVIFGSALGLCYGLIYWGCKFLPRQYTRYIFGL